MKARHIAEKQRGLATTLNKIASCVAVLIVAATGIYFVGGFSAIGTSVPLIERAQYFGWQKLDAKGKPVAATDGPWRCVQDPQTGLVWENKSLDEKLHHGKWTYTWAYGRVPGAHIIEGSCTALDQCTTAALVAKANQQAWCGLRSWRLPRLQELQSLLDYSYPESAAKVCPCMFSATAASSYWAGDQDQSRRLYGINFKTGEVRSFPEHAALYLRLVAESKNQVGR